MCIVADESRHTDDRSVVPSRHRDEGAVADECRTAGGRGIVSFSRSLDNAAIANESINYAWLVEGGGGISYRTGLDCSRDTD